MELKLFNQDNIELLKTLPDNSIDSIVTDPPYGISFMGKKWDYDVPSVETWKECLRVLKPGGHILVACGTRTQHRMTVNIEDAGFEIRDVVAWIYGSGFPKSLNIGKAVDKLQGNGKTSSYKPNDKNKVYGKNYGGGVTDNTPSDNQFNGWGTALKPAMELWTMARKPLSENNIAQNVLKWGTGGINIDDSRVEYNDGTTAEDIKRKYTGNNENNGSVTNNFGVKEIKMTSESTLLGRFPANVIHDGSDEVTDLFPKTKSGKAGIRTSDGFNANAYGKGMGIKKGEFNGEYGDSGSASRFFYCAKASKSERNDGLDGFEEKNVSHDGRDTYIENPYQRHENIQKNNHPTVKPVALMRYLVKMITPTGGIVLDPFMGSGSTGVACMKENFNFTGIELDPEYFKIAEARINNQLE